MKNIYERKRDAVSTSAVCASRADSQANRSRDWMRVHAESFEVRLRAHRPWVHG
jgi:hypothetical protein